jgi:hypothetical protein
MNHHHHENNQYTTLLFILLLSLILTITHLNNTDIISHIQAKNLNLYGTLPQNLNQLIQLFNLGLQKTTNFTVH